MSPPKKLYVIKTPKEARAKEVRNLSPALLPAPGPTAPLPQANPRPRTRMSIALPGPLTIDIPKEEEEEEDPDTLWSFDQQPT